MPNTRLGAALSAAEDNILLDLLDASLDLNDDSLDVLDALLQ